MAIILQRLLNLIKTTEMCSQNHMQMKKIVWNAHKFLLTLFLIKCFLTPYVQHTRTSCLFKKLFPVCLMFFLCLFILWKILFKTRIWIISLLFHTFLFIYDKENENKSTAHDVLLRYWKILKHTQKYIKTFFNNLFNKIFHSCSKISINIWFLSAYGTQ